MLTVGLRKRANISVEKTQDDHSNADHPVPSSSGAFDPTACSTSNLEDMPSSAAAVTTPSRRAFHFLFVIVHVFALISFIAGFVLRIPFHTGEECDMTYSMRVFLEISSPSNTIDNNYKQQNKQQQHYKLHKFVDRRDPRYQTLLRSPQPLTLNRNLCAGRDHQIGDNDQNNATIVLFIPGHWGSYSQSRSLGAHGVQLTEQRMDAEKIQRKLLATNRDFDVHNFFYDVFSVDFAEQGGALHGEFLLSQSDYVARVIEMLASECGVPSISVVGHSMGGIVAELALIRHVKIAKFVPNIITLATPHSNPLYAFDKSVHDVYHLIEKEQQAQPRDTSSLLVSISGGIRDEMIEPSACSFSDERHSERLANVVSVLAQDLLPLHRGVFGMDHRAIAWCHGTLEQVRKVLWILAEHELGKENHRGNEANDVVRRRHKVEKILQTRGARQSFMGDVREMNRQFYYQYGVLRAWCMESAMLYNLPLLLGIYSIIGCLRFGFAYTSKASTATAVLIFFVTSGVAVKFCDTSKPVSLVLCLVANTIHSCLSWIVPLGFLKTSHRTGFLISSLFGLFVLVQSLAFVYSRAILGNYHAQSLDCVLYIFCVAVVYWALVWLVGFSDANDTSSYRISSYTALVALTVPASLAGAITLMVWEESTRLESWATLFSTSLIPIGLVCLSNAILHRQAVAPGSNADDSHCVMKNARAAVVIGSIFFFSPLILSRGNAFQIARMIFAVSFAEITTTLIGIFFASAHARCLHEFRLFP